ncbi:MAG TPA: hypothetical protein VK996_01650 [Ramlibacter sp.]|nr:hypothetical protein [Ramlibacter sp.]
MTPPRRRVWALGIEGPSHELLLRWIAGGQLPNLARFRQRSAAFTIESEKKFSNEHCWIPVLTGRRAERWDHWLDHWNPQTYRFSEASLMDWLQAPLFYALGKQRTVVAFDLTAPVGAGVQGVQVSGWASELNESFPASEPPELLAQLLARHGHDPKLASGASTITNQLSMREGVSHVIPTMYDTALLQDYAARQVRSVQRRVAACDDILSGMAWDLFITSFSETHTAGHLLWHLSQPHALQALKEDVPDPMLAIYLAVDHAVGHFIEQAGPDDAIVVFTADSMGPDCLENARAVLLPEFVYRWNFPGKAALADGIPGTSAPDARFDFTQHWKHEVWKLRTPTGDSELESPASQEARQDAMSWCPANWYAPLWPRMRAFALPTVADGYVRINVRGREAQGLVGKDEYAAVCDELARDISALVNARTGQPLVREVIRVRESPFDSDPKKPPADLIVVFHEDGPVDTADSPRFGRIGPLPFFRTGSHPAHGSVMRNLMYVAAPGIEPGERQEVARLEDLPATLLSLLGLDVPAQFDGVARN